MKNKILVVDGNNLLHRVYYKFSSMRSFNGSSTSISYGFPMVLQSIITKIKPKKVIVVFDGGRSKYRIDLLPDYKRRIRKDSFDADDFYRQFDIVKKFLEILCIPYIQMENEEADDLIWLVARKFKRKYRVIIMSSDKDFNQLLSKNITIWNPKRKMMVTIDNVKELFGYHHYQCVDYLSLDGDNSDNIKGYKGVGIKTAIKFLEEHNSIKEYLLSPKEITFKKIDKPQLEEIWLKNRLLIDIKLYCRKYIDYKKFKRSRTIFNKEIDIKELKLICADNSIKSFIKKPFIKTFKNLLKNA